MCATKAAHLCTNALFTAALFLSHVCVRQGGSLGCFPHTSVMSEQVGVHKGATLLLNEQSFFLGLQSCTMTSDPGSFLYAASWYRTVMCLRI